MARLYAPAAEGFVLTELEQRSCSGAGVSRRYQRHGTGCRLPDPADVCRDHGEASREGFVQDLWEPFGPGDVEEHLAFAVEGAQASVLGDVSAKLRVAVEAEFAEASPELLGERALSADDQTPAGIVLHQPSENVGQHQRVLLRVQAANTEHLQLAVVVKPLRFWCDDV